MPLLDNMHRAPRFALVASALVCGFACTAARPAAAPAPAPAPTMRSAIVAMLDSSTRAWNRGDLDGFVRSYLDSDRTTYVGRRGIVRGRAGIRAVYASGYARQFAPGGQRDSLAFEHMEVDSLAPDVAHVLAYYVLVRGGAVVARGPTSLVLLRSRGRWRIVHDHSS